MHHTLICSISRESMSILTRGGLPTELKHWILLNALMMQSWGEERGSQMCYESVTVSDIVTHTLCVGHSSLNFLK